MTFQCPKQQGPSASSGCGRQNAGVWPRNLCLFHILRGMCTNFIISDRLWKLPILHCHTSRFGFRPLFFIGPTLFLVGKKPCYIIYVLNDVIWWNRRRWEAAKCISTQHLCSGCMNRVFLLQSCFRLPVFGHSILTRWRHQPVPPVQLPFLSCTYYRQRQMETWNCWPQLLDHVGTFGFLQGSCILQNSPVHVSWYVILEEASKYKWGFFAAVWRGSARHSTCGVSFIRLHSKKK